MSKIIRGRPLYIDVDSTLCFDEADLTPEQREKNGGEIVQCFGREILVFPHRANIAVLIKLYNRGYTLIVHSHTGAKWAQSVSLALDVDKYVSYYAAKPQYYMDDIDVEHWFGERIYREYES